MTTLTEKEFLSDLGDLVTKLRTEIEAKQNNIDPSPEAIKNRRKRVLKGDFKFFAYTYFPHHIWGEQSKFQEQFCQRFPQLVMRPGGCKEWWVAPRGESKSTLLTKIGPCFLAVIALLQKKEVRVELDIKNAPPFMDYLGFLGAETKMPAKLIEVVKTELTMNSNLAMDFPEACGAGFPWRIGDAVTASGVKLESWGAEQAIRGTFHGASRPKILLGDDLITDKEAKSPTERNNRWDWLEKAIDYLGPPDGTVKYLGVGTVLNDDDPISRAKTTVGHVVHHFKAIVQMPEHMHFWEECERLMRNDDKRVIKKLTAKGKVFTDEDLPSFQYYKKRKKRMEQAAITSWPSVRSLYWLMRQRVKNKKAFGTEMQGEARNDEDKVFTDISFWVSKLQHWIYFGACDPSMGKGETSDPSALLVGAWDTQERTLQVVAESIKRRVPSKLASDLIAMQQEFKCGGWAFENNNAYEHMRGTFVDAGIAKKIPLSLSPITQSVPQEVRIDSLEPLINDMEPKILFHSKLVHLLGELDDWPEKQDDHHYDGLTALEMLWIIAVSRGGGLPPIGTGKRRGKNDYTKGY